MVSTKITSQLAALEQRMAEALQTAGMHQMQLIGALAKNGAALTGKVIQLEAEIKLIRDKLGLSEVTDIVTKNGEREVP
jgi:DNA-binding transcriptional regulator YiaG